MEKEEENGERGEECVVVMCARYWGWWSEP